MCVTLRRVLSEIMYIQCFARGECTITGSYHNLYGNEIYLVPEPPLSAQTQETLLVLYITKKTGPESLRKYSQITQQTAVVQDLTFHGVLPAGWSLSHTSNVVSRDQRKC